jgi:polyisoprenoid-binding protein YceI
MRVLMLLLGMCVGSSAVAQNLFEISKGKVDFHSRAPLELIHASSEDVKGVIDVKNKQFAFKVNIVSFEGFNSPLQREHFNENYMETKMHPGATFSGKIIEDVDLRKDGIYTVRAKGKLTIHGIEQERIINSQVTVKNNRISINSEFVVALADHSIKIPRVVYDKLAPDINVTVDATLLPKK